MLCPTATYAADSTDYIKYNIIIFNIICADSLFDKIKILKIYIIILYTIS